ncbi:MAG: hypothetical protein ABI591_32230 [Kofleriaceae bacterium]
MRYVLFALLAACTIACTVNERDQTGPQIHIDLQSSFEDASDQQTTNEFSLDTDPQYSAAVTITTTDGTEDTMTMFSSYEVTDYHATFAVPGVTLTDSTFTADDSFGSDPSFKRDSPLVIPGSAKGQKLTVHVDASDSRGLAANVIDFTVTLN